MYFQTIISTLSEDTVSSIITTLFSGGYIAILNLLLTPQNINNEYLKFPPTGIIIPFERTLLSWAIITEQVDLVEFLINKGSKITYGNLCLATLRGRNIDITYIILENASSDVISELDNDAFEYIVENENLDVLRMLFYRGVNFERDPVYNIMEYNENIANFMLDAGLNVIGQNFELVPWGISQQTEDRLRALGANIIIPDIKTAGDFHKIGDYYYDANLGTVFIQEKGRYIVVGSNDNFLEGPILPPDNIALRYAEIYNLEVRNINQ